LIISEKQEADAREALSYAVELLPKDLKDKDMKNGRLRKISEGIDRMMQKPFR
jgi:hypothetical protein